MAKGNFHRLTSSGLAVLALASSVCAQDPESPAKSSTDIVGSISFAGWGNPAQDVTGEIKFTGLGELESEIFGVLSFVGIEKPEQELYGSLSFVGVALPTNSILGELTFVGVANPITEISGALSFVGCGELPEPIEASPEEPPDYLAPSLAMNIGMEGNYIVYWGISESGVVGWDDSEQRNRAFATLTKGGTWDTAPEGSDLRERYLFVRDLDDAWGAQFWFPPSSSQASQYNSSESIEMRDGGVMQIKQGARWNRNMESTLIAAQDRIVGEWRNRDGSGFEIWTRVPSRVTHVSAVLDGHTETQAIGMPVKLISPYVALTYTARGLRKEVVLRVYGEGLWGRHYLWISRNSGLEIAQTSYICANPETGYDTHPDDQVCFQQGGVVGQEVPMIVWHEARTGPQTLFIDGEEIIFDLEITGAPEDELTCAGTE